MLIFENFLSYSQRQQFSFTKTNEYLSVSKNSQVFTSKLKDEVYVLSPRFPGVCFFKIITKYSLNIYIYRLVGETTDIPFMYSSR